MCTIIYTLHSLQYFECELSLLSDWQRTLVLPVFTTVVMMLHVLIRKWGLLAPATLDSQATELSVVVSFLLFVFIGEDMLACFNSIISIDT